MINYDPEKIYDSRKELEEELRATKYDLEDCIGKLFRYRDLFNKKAPDKTEYEFNDHAYRDLGVVMNEMLASYTAPAYHYNNYIEAIIRDMFWDDIKYEIPEEEREWGALRRAKYQMEVQAIFLSIKMALDRLVLVFSYYYRGVSTDTTFGRYRDNGRPRGLMSKVNELKDSDDLMTYIESAYHQWIKIAVSPRDMITHYNDLAIHFEWDSDLATIIPSHVNQRIIEKKNEGRTPNNKSAVDQQEKIGNTFSFVHLCHFVSSWYEFCERIISSLIERPLISERPRI